MKFGHVVFFLIAIILGACGSGKAMDTKPIQGVWNRDDVATLEALMKSTIPRDFIEEHSDTYFRPTSNVIEIVGSKITLSSWGVTCDFAFDGEEIRLNNCPEKGNDGAYTKGLESYFISDGKIVEKDIDGNVIAVYVRGNDSKSETGSSAPAMTPQAAVTQTLAMPTSEVLAIPTETDGEDNAEFQAAVENCREARVQEAQESTQQELTDQMIDEISRECVTDLKK